MINSVREPVASTTREGTVTAFSAAFQRDGVAVITATSARVRTFSSRKGPLALPGEMSSSHPRGAFVVTGDRVRWRPAVNVTRLLTTAEVAVAAVLVARRLSQRPSATKAQVTMGPGGWVSMKSGAVAVRPASRPWGRPRPVTGTGTPARRPVWARLLSAVPLRSLLN
jgi:hypothetical protein